MSTFNDIREQMLNDRQQLIDEATESYNIDAVQKYALINEHIEYIKFYVSDVENRHKFSQVVAMLQTKYDINITDSDTDIIKLLAKHGIYKKKIFDRIIMRILLLYFTLVGVIAWFIDTINDFNHGTIETIVSFIFLGAIFAPLLEHLNRINFYRVNKSFKKRIHK